MDDLIGKSVGPYVIAERLGEGGMAEVYSGYQESLNRYVAIKVLRGELARDQEFVARFRREALAVGKLSHPNILHVYDAGVSNGMYYIVMDYAAGGSLKELLQNGPIEQKQAVSIAIQLAEALDYAHQQGLVHRDVKPSNVLMTRDGRPLLTDFGIAKVLHQETQLTRTGTAIGTPEYMSPEQLQGQSVDARTDIYALGAVLFEMLAGWSPFSAPTPMATMYKQMNEPPPPLRQVNINIPEWLESIVGKALAKQPGERYQRSRDMAEALRESQSALGGAAATAAAAATAPGGTPSPMPPQAQPDAATKIERVRKKRSPVPLLVGAIVILAIALGGVAAFLALGDSLFGPSSGVSPTAIVVVASPQPTDTPLPTDTTAPEPEPSLTPEPPPATVELDTPTAMVVVVTATGEPQPEATATSLPPTAAPTSPPTEAPPTEAPTAAPTSPPAATKEPVSSGPPGTISNFESFGTWKRGDQANGTFTQSGAESHEGSRSGKLDYDFGTSANDYVVFQQTRKLDGSPTRISAWVLGDKSGHFLNVWIKDSGGQVWQVPLGTIDHTGWQEMSGAVAVNQDWPWTHISGTDNGVVDYPISFTHLVLDDKPDSYVGSGTIYIDDLMADTGNVSTDPGPSPTKAASAQATSAPAPSGLSGVSGRIVYSVGGQMHIVDASSGNDMIGPIGGMYQPDFRSDGHLIIANGEGGGKTSIWTINASSGAFVREQSPFTNDFSPFWSPDAGQFTYDSFHQGGKFADSLMLYKQTLDSKDDQALNHGGQNILGSSPVWMHDDWIAFTGCDYWPGGSGGSKCGIYRMPSWGGQPAMVKAGSLTTRATDNHGGQLAFMSQESGDWEAYIVPNTGGGARNLSNSPSSNDGLPTFSPDGKLVAFVSNRGGGWAVWAVRTDGSGLTKLFNLSAPPSNPFGNWTGEHISWGP